MAGVVRRRDSGNRGMGKAIAAMTACLSQKRSDVSSPLSSKSDNVADTKEFSGLTLCLRSKRSEVRILSGVPTPTENTLLRPLGRNRVILLQPSDRLPGDLSVLVPSTFRVNEAAA